MAGSRVLSQEAVDCVYALVVGLKNKHMYTKELETLTKSIVGVDPYELIVQQEKKEQNGAEKGGVVQGEEQKASVKDSLTGVGDGSGREVKESLPAL